MQAFSGWTAPTGTLGAIVREAEARAHMLQARIAELERACVDTPGGPSLRHALQQNRQTVSLIAEVKRRSPSKGAIAEGLEPVAQVRAYAEGGAAAVSILTEPAHFGGSVDDLASVRAHVAIPVLKKDFHVSEIQLLEARALGSSAALLIARALHPRRLEELMHFGVTLGLELLIEVRDEAELECALGAGADMVGVNNRNLETLVIDPSTSDRIIPLVPVDVVAVAESGVRTREDVERYGAVGADAVLVGSVLSAHADPIAATRALVGIARRTRGG